MISVELIKQLRLATGAGIVECKKALDKANGDLQKAIEIMRKGGQAKAEKKSDRITAEGIILGKTSPDYKRVVLLEINCETDFVSRSDIFRDFAEKTASICLKQGIKNPDDLKNCLYEEEGFSDTFEKKRYELVMKLGENIQLRKLIYIETADKVVSYVHNNKIGALVEFQGENITIGQDIALHIVAANPLYLDENSIPDQVLAKEREIYTHQASTSGKPRLVIEKMVEGQMRNYVNQSCLLAQSFVKDSSITIESLLAKNTTKIKQFIRLVLGEGIKKNQDSFFDAVMAQLK